MNIPNIMFYRSPFTVHRSPFTAYHPMRYRRLGRTDLLVSEIGLGTVELGIDYGIRTGQTTNQPSEHDASRLLNRALDLGVNYIDTAAAYGTSEETIGQALCSRRDEYILATKCMHWYDEGLPVTEVQARVEASIDQSLRRLQTDRIDLIQIHGRDVSSLETLMIDEGGVYEALDRARQAGKVRHIGYSSYSEEASLKVLAHGGWDTLQIAYNIFDQRNDARVIPNAKALDVGLIIRSALLKGALTDKASHLPAHLKPLIDRTRALKDFLSDTVPSIPQLALRFVLSNQNISTVIVGVDTIPYLEEAVSVADGQDFTPDVLDALRAMAMDDPELINPARWGIP